jgi:hypothetical protein
MNRSLVCLRCGDSPIAVLNNSVKACCLDDSAHFRAVGIAWIAKLGKRITSLLERRRIPLSSLGTARDAVDVFDVEYGLAVEEAVVIITLVKFCTLLVDGKLYDRGHGREDFEGILETNTNARLGTFALHES